MGNSSLTVGIIGGGNMGSAIVSGIYKRYDVCVCEKDKQRAQSLKSQYKVELCDIKNLIEQSYIVLLAVKPQQFDTILAEVKRHITSNNLVVSIAAGITTRYIEKKLGAGVKVIRTMPNLPAQIGEGITGVCKGQFAKDEDVTAACDLLQNIGETVVLDEKHLDALTAVSGSGPAYVFLFVECFLKAAKSLGLEENLSKTLIMETIKGSMKLLEASHEDPGALRERVTSKGGTTEAALEVFAKNKFQDTFREALIAAKRKANQLSK